MQGKQPMASTPTSSLWVGRLTFLTMGLLLIFIQLLPLNTMPRAWAPPDILLAMTLAWTARRPDFAPAILIAGLFFLADLLFQRPPGLCAALVLVFTEMLRSRATSLRSAPFPLEWFTVSIGIVGIAIAGRLISTVVMIQQPPVVLTSMQAALTILIYPVVVAVAHLIFGVSRPAPGEVDALGHRI